MLFSCVEKSILERSKIDAIETINSRLFPFHSKIEQSKRLAEQLQKPQTAGSDAHLPLEIGNAYAVIFSKSIEVDDILYAIKQGKTEVYGIPTPLISRMKKLMLQFLK
jgi:predicted metal-dependent phosphoesterase TrpH